MMQRSVSNPTMTSVVSLCLDTDLSMPCNREMSPLLNPVWRSSPPVFWSWLVGIALIWPDFVDVRDDFSPPAKQ